MPKQLEMFDKKIIRSDGVGEAAVVQDLINADPSDMSPEELVNMIKGMQALANNGDLEDSMSPQLEQYLRRMQANMERMEKRLEAYENDKETFLEEVQRNGEKKLLSPAKRQELAVQEGQRLQGLVGEKVKKKMSLKKRLMAEEQELVVWPGEVRMSRKGANLVPVMLPTEVRLGPFFWAYAVGTQVKVPASVATRLREIAKSKEETQARKEAIGVTRIVQEGEMVKGWKGADDVYSKSEALPIVGEV